MCVASHCFFDPDLLVPIELQRAPCDAIPKFKMKIEDRWRSGAPMFEPSQRNKCAFFEVLSKNVPHWLSRQGSSLPELGNQH